MIPKDMSEYAAGFGAGLLEGEGSAVAITVNEGRQTYARLTIQMTDLEPLELMQRTFGGSINGPYQPKPSELGTERKVHWKWTLTAWKDLQAAVEAMWPLLSPRRQAKIAEVMGKDSRWGHGKRQRPAMARDGLGRYTAMS